MQGVQSTRRFSPGSNTRLTGIKITSSSKARKADVVVDKAKPSSYSSKLSNLGPHQCYETESNVPRKKHVMPEKIEGDTQLRSMPTPINIYEDECVFCHSFRTTPIHGPMVRYLSGQIVSSNEINHSSNGTGIYVHWKCLDWAPRVWFEGDTVRNLESEIRRASRLRCHRCGHQGAALGCYYEHCNKSFHVPCAVQIYDCRWDVDNRSVLCPEHVSEELPCDKQSSQTKEGQKFSSLTQSKYSERVDNYRAKNQQTDELNASNSPSGPSSQLYKEVSSSGSSSREGQQIDQLTASSSLRLSGCPDEEGISNACQREEMKIDGQELSSYPSDKLVFLGLSLSASEKDSLRDFACWTDATVTNEWGENVTHVIVGKNAGSECRRSYEVLMAILFGKWILRAEWIVDCLNLCPDAEDSYEVTFCDDSSRPLDGPKKGRTRAAKGGRKLFSGLRFCLSAWMNPGDRGRMQNLVEAAGGSLVEPSSGDDASPGSYFVYDGGVSAFSMRVEEDEAMEHAAAGARVISHKAVMEAVAAYDAEVLDRRGR